MTDSADAPDSDAHPGRAGTDGAPDAGTDPSPRDDPDAPGDADDPEDPDDPYAIVERLPTVEEFRRLRAAADMAARSEEAVRRGLPNSLYGVVAVHDDGRTVGMGRVVGDGGAVYHLSDMAVHPDHQRRGVGTRIGEALVAYVREDAPPGAYVNLMADVDGFYERLGFEETRPASKGMYLRIDRD